MRLGPVALPARQRGVTLVELMIGVAIGLLLTAALLSLFVNISKSSQEQFKSAEQIENGRFAIDLLTSDLRHAGFYGEFAKLPLATSFVALPDPCTVPAEGDVTEVTTNSPLAFHVQGYPAASAAAAATVPAACATWIDNASLKPGSDIVVVRRLDTQSLIDPPDATSNAPVIPATSRTPLAGDVFAQATSTTLNIQYGAGVQISYPTGKSAGDCKLGLEMNAKNVASTLFRKDYAYAQTVAAGVTRCNTAAQIRKLHVHVYFVANCRSGLGTNGKCNGAAGEDSVPTLKRLELTAGSGGAPTMALVPLVEGIEFMKVRYGLDTNADGIVDSTVAAPAALADWQNAVMADVRLLARNREASGAGSDSKTYDLGAYSYAPAGTAATFKRHLFTQQVYISNVGGRREN